MNIFPFVWLLQHQVAHFLNPNLSKQLDRIYAVWGEFNCLYLFPGSFLRPACVWRACGQRGGRVGQRVWGDRSSVGALWPLGPQSGPHCDLTGLEAHERSVSTGRTGGQWLWGDILGVEVLYVFLKFSSYFSSVRQFPIGLIVLNEKLCVCCSRVYQMSKLYLFSPSSGLYTCPLAMTDGAAKVIQVTSYSVLYCLYTTNTIVMLSH